MIVPLKIFLVVNNTAVTIHLSVTRCTCISTHIIIMANECVYVRFNKVFYDVGHRHKNKSNI